jgi:hypothetical protein
MYFIPRYQKSYGLKIISYICKNVKWMIVPILIADKKNLNDRYYDTKSLEKIISDYNKERERLGQCFGVFRTEPDYYSYGERGLVSIRDIAFTVDSMEIEGKILIADINILKTPAGNDLKGVIDLVVFRTCVWGNLEEDGRVEIENLISINAIYSVHDPFRRIKEINEKSIYI